MTVTVRTLDQGAKAAWEAFVEQCPGATFFHRAGWASVIERSFGQKTHFLYAERGGQICGVLPLAHVKSRLFSNGLVSTAYCVGGGIAALDDEAYDALDRHAQSLLASSGAEYLEYRDPARLHDGWERREGLYAGFSRPIAAAEDENLKQIPRKQRAVVRKTLESDLQDVIDTDVDRFFSLYAPSVRNLGTPVYAKKYFANLLTEFGKDCDILTITHQGRAISSVLNFYFRDQVMPYYTGCVAEARSLGANDFMYWRLMRRAVERGYSVFDFGRSKVGTGPYSFKKNWGFEPRPVVHEFKMRDGGPVPEINPTNPKYRMFIALWKRLPLPIANLLGPHIVRNIA